MKLCVLVKQVPETTDVTVDPETGFLMRDGVASIVNPFDTYALEEAVRTKEKLGGEVIAISMGPPQAEGALRECISVGADRAVLVCDRALAGSDTLATGYALALVLKKVGYDLIFCGKQAIDGDTAQVGPGVATHLALPQAAYVRKIREIDEKHVIAERLLEDGTEVVDLPLPAVLTVVKEINEPRLPSLRGKMKARKAEIEIFSAAEMGGEPGRTGAAGSPTRVMRVFSPPKREGGVKWTGEPQELAGKLVEELASGHVI